MTAQRPAAPHGFENMEVFQLALDFLLFADEIEDCVAQRKWALNRDFQKAVVSILANIGEGATEISPAEKKRFYRYALRSTGECSALLHGIERLELIAPDRVGAGKALLLRIRIGLLKLIKTRLRPLRELQRPTPRHGPTARHRPARRDPDP